MKEAFAELKSKGLEVILCNGDNNEETHKGMLAGTGFLSVDYT